MMPLCIWNNVSNYVFEGIQGDFMRRTISAILLLVLAGCATTGTSGTTDKHKMAEGYYNRGISHLQTKDFEKAMVEFQRSINTDPKFKMSYYAMGMVYDMMGKFSDAEKYYKLTIDIDSDFSDAYNSLGTIYMKQKKWKEALKAFQKALQNKMYATPNITYVNIGDVYLNLEDYPKAIEAYQEAKRYANQDYIIYRLGMALIRSGKTKEAIGELQEGVALTPKNPDMRLALGLALLKDGNKNAAIIEFKKVVELVPQSDAAKTARDYINTLDQDAVKKQKTR
jgi:Tfp pilus assembly protein PilF